MECNGKCFLKKELAKSSEGSENSKKKDGQRSSFENTIVYYQELEPNVYLITANYNNGLVQNYHYNNLYSYLYTGTTFHPPATV